MISKLKLFLLAASGLAMANAAHAAANNPPPAGPVILNLSGTPTPGAYTLYSQSFIATSALTNLSFAFREDPAFLYLDDVTMTNVTTPGPNLVLNGGFESGPVGANAPANWTYLNIFGATFAGVVATNHPHSGSNNYYDGAVQAYDAITQAIVTNPGDTYNVSFWLDDDGPYGTFSALSTNGNTTGTGGNGVNLVVYAGDLPTDALNVPEPFTLSLFGAGLAGAIATRRRKKAVQS